MDIILDCDPGIDDMFAIMLIAKSNELNLKGVTTVDGNCKLKYTIVNSFKILDLAGRNDVPVYKGMDKSLKDRKIDAVNVHGENGAGGVFIEEPKRELEEESAIDYLIREVSENPGKITVVAIGPLTNIACCVMKDEKFAQNVKQLVIMGGAEKKGNITKFAEFNFYKDPEAAQIVFESGFKDIVMVGLDVTTKLPLIDKFEDMLIDIDSEVSKFLYDISRSGAKFDREVNGLDGCILNDPLTIAYLLDNSMLELKDSFVDIITEGEEMGRSVIHEATDENKANCKVAYGVDSSKFYNVLFKRIFPERENEIDNIIKNI